MMGRGSRSRRLARRARHAAVAAYDLSALVASSIRHAYRVRPHPGLRRHLIAPEALADLNRTIAARLEGIT